MDLSSWAASSRNQSIAPVCISHQPVKQSEPPRHLFSSDAGIQSATGTCWANAMARVLQSTFLRMYGHPQGNKSEREAQKSYWELVNKVIEEGQRHGFSHKIAATVRHFSDNSYKFLTYKDLPNVQRDKWEKFMYDGYLPRAALISIRYPKGSLDPFKQGEELDTRALRRIKKAAGQVDEAGHCMALVGVAWRDGKRYWVILNSWGEAAHGAGEGFWLLEDNDKLIEALQTRVIAVSYNKAHGDYRKYGDAWSAASKKERRAWRERLVQRHNGLMKHLEGFRRFARCPKWHPLYLRHVKEPGRCSDCRKKVKSGDQVKCCERCNFYLCFKCCPCKEEPVQGGYAIRSGVLDDYDYEEDGADENEGIRAGEDISQSASLLPRSHTTGEIHCCSGCVVQ